MRDKMQPQMQLTHSTTDSFRTRAQTPMPHHRNRPARILTVAAPSSRDSPPIPAPSSDSRRRAPNPGTQSPLPHPERPQSRRPARILTAPQQPDIGAPSSPRRVPNPGAAPPPSRRVSASRRRPSRRPGEVLNGRLPSAPLPRRAAASVQRN